MSNVFTKGPEFTLEVYADNVAPFLLEVGDSIMASNSSENETVNVHITASTALAAYRAVTIDGYYTEENYDSLSKYAGVTKGSFNSNQKDYVIREGLITNELWNWTLGIPVYASNSGILTQTAPLNARRRIGYPVSAISINLDVFDFLTLSQTDW